MEYTALYRRFRPISFKEILGQEHITTTLKNQVISDRVGHAYLFTGSRGCGKTSSAKVLARAINCLNVKDGEPCNECSICESALDGSLTDIVEMDAASNNGVDDIRAIRDEVNFLPTIAKYRVYIIDEVHMLSTGAFNALLKTLEEPPKHVKFILATTEPQKLPATILSRCQRFDFKKISENKIIENLEKICEECKIKYASKALDLIAELAEGGMRDALSILERCAEDGENQITEDKIKDLVGIPEKKYISKIVETIINYNTETALEITEQAIKEGKDINNLLWETVKYIKDILLLKTTNSISNIYNEEDIRIMQDIINNVEKQRLLNIIYDLSKLENDIKWSSQKNIVFQVGILKLCTEETYTIIEQNKKNQTKNIIENKKISDEKENNQKIKTLKNNEEIIQENNQKIGENDKKNSEKNQTPPKAVFWNKVIETLRQDRNQILCSNLVGTNAIIIDDMTVGIEFQGGINSFKKSIIEKSENMNELRRLVSIECKKDMRIKLIEGEHKTITDIEQVQSSENNNSLGIGININIID